MAYLITRDDVDVSVNPVPRGIATRQSRSRNGRGLPLVRGVRWLPRILDPEEIEALMAALRTDRDRAMVQAMVLGGLRRCEVLGLKLSDLRLGEWRVMINEGKGGHERLVPLSPTFFATVARYMNEERPAETTSDSLFVSLKGQHRGQPLSTPGLDEIVRAARKRAGLSHGTCHELRHTCFTRLREAGDDHRSHPGPGWTPLHLLDTGLSAPGRRLAGRRVPAGGRGHRGPGSGGGGSMSALAQSVPPRTRRPGGGTPEATHRTRELPTRTFMVEMMGLEPTTPCLQSRCSSQLSYIPECDRLNHMQSVRGPASCRRSGFR
jgi:hypothetical protein